MDIRDIIAEADQQAALHVLAYHNVEGGKITNPFTIALIEAFTLADAPNFDHLSEAYPRIAYAVRLYQYRDNGIALLQQKAKGVTKPEVFIERGPENSDEMIAARVQATKDREASKSETS